MTQESYLYPWGNEFQTGLANCEENSCQDGFSETSPVGSFSPAGDSPYRLQDMAGNVWEWTSNWHEAYPGNSIPNGDYGEKYKTLRSGSWSNLGKNVNSSNREWSYTEGMNSNIGFRCVSTLD